MDYGMKLKKPKLLRKPDTLFVKAADKDIHRYTRLQRRWARDHLAQNGLRLQNSSDSRIIEFLDMCYKAQKEAEKGEKKAIKGMDVIIDGMKTKLDFAKEKLNANRG
jgi:hypothetical protein